jgi:pyruvate formate lyase activating enzyme
LPDIEVHAVQIGGFQKFSLADFPGHISAIIFTLGCGFRCPYCHNPELVDPLMSPAIIPQEAILEFLESRKGQVDGVVVSGGEPTLQSDLPDLLAGIKRWGFAVKLDTNGSNPDMLVELLCQGLLDYIAMDVKAPLEQYARVVRAPADPVSIRKSIEIVRSSGIDHEFRTTYLESLLSIEEMMEIAVLVQGCAGYVLQRFQPTNALDATLLDQGPTSEAAICHVQSLMEAAGIPARIR